MINFLNNTQKVNLEIEGYAYPFSRDDWDANWLSVSVQVVDFFNNINIELNDNCLLTIELQELINWFEKINNNDEDSQLKFIEPSLSFFYKNPILTLQLNYNLNPDIDSNVPFRIEMPINLLNIDNIINSMKEYANKYPKKGDPK